MKFDFNNVDMVKSKLTELVKQNIPKMSLEHLLNIDEYSYLKGYAEKASQEEMAKVNDHFSKYCIDGYNDGRDIFSDERCTFYWGLRHGEMITDDNGLNRTYYHYINLGGHEFRIDLLLQYHPDVYQVAE